MEARFLQRSLLGFSVTFSLVHTPTSLYSLLAPANIKIQWVHGSHENFTKKIKFNIIKSKETFPKIMWSLGTKKFWIDKYCHWFFYNDKCLVLSHLIYELKFSQRLYRIDWYFTYIREIIARAIYILFVVGKIRVQKVFEAPATMTFLVMNESEDRRSCASIRPVDVRWFSRLVHRIQRRLPTYCQVHITFRLLTTQHRHVHFFMYFSAGSSYIIWDYVLAT